MGFKKYVTSIWLFSLWPIFLFISQKYLLIADLFNLSFYKFEKKAFYRSLFFLFAVSACSFFTFITSAYNEYSVKHFLSYIIFLLYSVLLCGVLGDSKRAMKILSLITFLNFFGLVLIHYVFYFEIDLSGARGLNFIKGADGTVHRFFIETSPLFLVSKFDLVRPLGRRLLFVFLTVSYFLFIAKITFLSILFFIFLFSNHLKNIRNKSKSLLFFFFVLFVGLILLFVDLNNFIRQDLLLSISFKIEQFRGIFTELSIKNIFFGEGFGFFLEEFVTDLNQPYQIEMQLPMLLLQLGVVNILMLIFFIYFLFKSIRIDNPAFVTLLFFLVGIVNPWLFLPVWMISVLYLFKN